MELKALFWTVMIAGLLAAGVLLRLVSEQMSDRTRSSPFVSAATLDRKRFRHRFVGGADGGIACYSRCRRS